MAVQSVAELGLMRGIQRVGFLKGTTRPHDQAGMRFGRATPKLYSRVSMLVCLELLKPGADGRGKESMEAAERIEGKTKPK